VDRKKGTHIARQLILETIDTELFEEYWDVGNLFYSYLERFDDVALAVSLTLWTISSEDFKKWNLMNL